MESLNPMLSAFASAFSQERRLFSLRFTDNGLDSELLPHTLSGEEHISAPYKLSLECLCANADLELKTLIGLGIDVAIHTVENDRVISGVVTAARQLGADGGFARYGLTVEPLFAVLQRRRNSRVFQNKSVIEITNVLLDEHIANNPVFAQCFRHRDQTTRTYPSRSYCQQYRESDFDFIMRLLHEEGISYLFDFEHGSGETGLHTLVLFDAGTELQESSQSNIRFHRADATEDEDSITQWRAQRQIRSGAVALASYDYKSVYTQQGNDKAAIDHGENGSGLAASLEDYDPQSLARDYSVDATDSDELNRYAQLRQQSHDLNGKTFFGEGVVRGLGAGQSFTLNNHPAHEDDSESDRQFVVLGQRFNARNNLPGEFDDHSLAAPLHQSSDKSALDTAGYKNTFSAVRKTIPIVPEYAHGGHAKPIARGAQTATVVGPTGEEIFTDELGRIKIQFHWARAQDHDPSQHGAGANNDDYSSCWVRVLMPSAGAQYGHQFIPRIGQEVLVDFIEGDIDRPLVIRVLHNGQHTPPTFQNAGALPANKTLSGIKTHEYKGARHNEIVFDDTANEIRTTLSTEHGKTQLHQGYLIHPRSEGKGSPRGEGFELRTDNAGAIRSAQGLLITTEAQVNASGKQLDRSAATAQLQAAQNLTQALGDSAQQQTANKVEPDPKFDNDYFKSKQPHIHLHGHGGMATTTPQSTAIAAGKDIHVVALRDHHQTSGRGWIHNVVESASLFVANSQSKMKTAIKLLAAKGDVLIQAQSNDVEITADKNIAITACKETLTASAGNTLMLQSGGGYIKISGGNIDIHCPGSLSMKAKSFVHEGGGGGSVVVSAMPKVWERLQSVDQQLIASAPANSQKPPEKNRTIPVMNTAVTAGLGPDIDQLVSKSPSLQKDLKSLNDDGWKIVYGSEGGGSFADRDSVPPKITIDGNLKGNPTITTQTLAHEVGHATYSYQADYTSKTAYVNGALADEGAATLNNIKVQREIISNGGPDIGIAGNPVNQTAYNKAYENYLSDGNSTSVRQAIGNIFGKGEITSNTKQPYAQYYGSWYDKAFPPK